MWAVFCFFDIFVCLFVFIFLLWPRSKLKKCSRLKWSKTLEFWKWVAKQNCFQYTCPNWDSSVSQLRSHSQFAFIQLTVWCTPSSHSSVKILKLPHSDSKFKDTEEKRVYYLSPTLADTENRNHSFSSLLLTIPEGEGKRCCTVTAHLEFGSRVQTQILTLVNGSNKAHGSTLSQCHFFSVKAEVITK